MKFNGQEYFKGFVITDRALEIEASDEIEFYGYRIYIDQQLPVHQFQGSRHIILLGYALDSHDASLTAHEILGRLDQFEKMEDYLNQINGRYVVIVVDDGQINIYPDATTMRPVFYHVNEPLIASHSHLLAAAYQSIYQQKLNRYDGTINGFLDYSSYHDIHKLNSNTVLNVNQMKQHRFYPSEEFQQRGLTEVTERTTAIFEEQKKWLMQKECFLTLTAGSDSRVSLALMKNRNLKTLTYLSNPERLSEAARIIYKNDERIVRMMREDLHLTHQMLYIDNKEVDSDYVELFTKQVESTHAYSLSEQLTAYKGMLHIKSTIFELAKLPYATQSYIDHDAIKRFIAYKVPKFLKGQVNIEVLIEDYFKRIDLDVNQLNGYYLADLFYQESRMGNWHSNITQETDNSVEVFVLLNTRELINLVTSLPLKDRENKMLHKEWINQLWPVLNFYPVNKEANLYEQFSRQKNLEQSAELYSIKGESIVVDGQTVIPRFPLDNKVCSFIIQNTAERPLNIILLSHYKNDKGRGLLQLAVREDVRDYLDINNGYMIKLDADEEVTVRMIFSKIQDKLSWQKAGSLSVKIEGE